VCIFNVKLAVSHIGYSMQGFSLLVLKLIVSETKTLTTALPSLTHLTRVSQISVNSLLFRPHKFYLPQILPFGGFMCVFIGILITSDWLGISLASMWFKHRINVICIVNSKGVRKLMEFSVMQH